MMNEQTQKRLARVGQLANFAYRHLTEHGDCLTTELHDAAIAAGCRANTNVAMHSALKTLADERFPLVRRVATVKSTAGARCTKTDLWRALGEDMTPFDKYPGIPSLGQLAMMHIAAINQPMEQV